MQTKTKYTIILIALVQLIIAGYLSLPRIVAAVPFRYQDNLPHELVALITTPLPTIPAAGLSAAQSPVIIPTIAKATAIPTPLPTATPIVAETAVPTAVPVATETPTPAPTPLPIPDAFKIEGLKIIPQNFNNCGPANLTVVLNFYGDPTTQDVAAAYLKPNPNDRNTSPWQLSDYVNEHTALRSSAHSGGDLDLLMRLIAAGVPVVIEKGYEPDAEQGWMGHYLTVFGYDKLAREFYSIDTYLGPWDGSGRVDSFDFVQKYWQEFDFTFYVVYRPDQEAVVNGILGPDMLDPQTMWTQAAEKSQAETITDPTNAFAWFNLGTSLTRLGELTGEGAYYQNGAAAFDKARTLDLPPRILWYQFRPYIAYMKVGRYNDMIQLADNVLTTEGGRNVEETYLYQGHALLLGNGDYAGAKEAYQRALQLNTNFYPAQWALDSLP